VLRVLCFTSKEDPRVGKFICNFNVPDEKNQIILVCDSIVSLETKNYGSAIQSTQSEVRGILQPGEELQKCMLFPVGLFQKQR
jgi:hypothetical protein